MRRFRRGGSSAGGGGRRINKWVLRAASVATFAFVWEISGRVGASLLMPSFTGMLTALARLAGERSFWEAFVVSNVALVVGFAGAAVLGVTLGLAIGTSPRVEAYTDPWLDILLILPLAALGPIFIMVFGVGLMARAVVVLAFALPVILVSAAAGMHERRRALVDMAEAFGASRFQIWRHVLLRSSLPAILAGLRMGLGRALTGMIVAELLVVAAGIGRLILEFQSNFDAASVYAVVTVVMLEAVLLTRGAARLERRLSFWSLGSAWHD
jgi:NitT/TauT family transport system permease protein